MISISEALRWLNQFDRSHLNGTNQRLFAAARNPRTDNAAIQDLLRAALQQARTSPLDSLDYPETLLNCAEISYNRGFFDQARDHLAAAASSYVRARDLYGTAVAFWMYGIVELRLQNPNASYNSWKKSARTFRKFRESNAHIPDTRDRYADTIIEMNQDLVTLPQESFSWLTRFDGSCISQFNHELINAIDENIKKGNANEANRIINVLKDRAKISPDPFEYAEIFAVAGLARFQMREYPLAIEDLKVTVTKYPADSHQKEVARWLLGAVQFWSENSRDWEDALKNWEMSIDGFRRLAQTADQNNKQKEKRWYRDKIVYMKGALKGKMMEFLPGNPTNFAGPSGNGGGGEKTPPSPPPQGPAPSHTQDHQDRYQYLCSLVGGDQSVADSLIELERRKMPNASRDELIERAIERLTDDRR